MKKRHFYKFLSFLMAVVFLFNMLLMCVNATPEEIAPQLQEQPREAMIIGSPDFDEEFEDISSLKELGPGEKPLEELREMTLDSNALPQFLSYSEAVSKGHVNRLYEQENDLSTIIYQNKDGGKTAYMFAKNIKYVDADGNIKDKSTKIGATQAKGYSYAMEQNNIKAYFPQQSTAGIKLTHNGYEISMKPKESAEKVSVTFNSSENKIVYAEVFGSNTFLVYEPFMEGVKEDIVLAKYTGQNEFEFILTAEGLTASKINEVWYLVDSNGEAVARFEDIIIKDSNGKTVEGSIDIVQQSDGTYEITVTADEEFLTAPDTSYPVYIDPTVRITEASAMGVVLDTGIYNGESTRAETDITRHYLGTYDEVEGRVIYRLTDFYDTSVGRFRFIDENQIYMASLHINIESNESETTLTAKTLSSTWDYLECKENSYYIENASELWNFDSDTISVQSEIYPVFDTHVSINITEIAKAWARYNTGKTSSPSCNPKNGFVLIGDSSLQQLVYSIEDNTMMDDNTYAEIDYSDDGGECFIYGFDSYKFMSNDDMNGFRATSFSNSTPLHWAVQYIGNDRFYIRSQQTGELLCGSGNNVALGTGTGNQYKWTLTWVDGGGYIIKNVASGKALSLSNYIFSLVSMPSVGTAEYEKCRFVLTKTSGFVSMSKFSLTDNYIVPGTSKFFHIKTEPANATWKGANYFTWTINSAKVSTTATPSLLMGNSAGTVTLTLQHKITGAAASFTIYCGDIRDGTYQLMNKNTSKYIYSPAKPSSTTTYLQQNSLIYQSDSNLLHGGLKWDIAHQANGEYTIYCAETFSYMGVSSSTGSAINYSSDNGSNTRWIIKYTSSGNYRLTPKNYTSNALRVPAGNTADGVHISQASYTNDSTYNDEWVIESVGETVGIKNGGIYNLVSSSSNLCLDVTGAGTANGTLVNQYQVMPAYHWQRWKFIYLGDGQYKIQDVNSGKLLSVSGSSASNDAGIHIWADDGTSGQVFKITQNIDGTYSFRSKCSSYLRAISIAGSSTDPGALAIQYSYNKYYTADNQKFTLQDSSKAIIIVPGIMGSELFIGENNPYFREGMPLFSEDMISQLATYENGDSISDLYGSFSENFLTAFLSGLEFSSAYVDSMKCLSNGTSKYDIVVKQYKKEFSSDQYTDHAGMSNTYSVLYDSLCELSENYVIDFFSYDWRLSNAISAQKLNQYIESYQYESVILVAHSMGGLVTSGYLALGETQRNKVEKVYLLASPLLGTPELVYIWNTNEFDSMFGKVSIFGGVELGTGTLVKFFEVVNLDTDLLESLLGNYQSIYELLPTKYYFSVANKTYLYDGSNELTTYASTKNKFITLLEHFKPTLMANAETFHDTLFINSNHVSTCVDTIYIYATKEDTANHLVLYENQDSETKLIKITDEIGDKLVPKWSAALGGLYYDNTYHEKSTHGDMIKASAFIDFIKNNIINSSNTKGLIHGYI